MAPPLEFWLYLPQMRLSLDQMVERARNAEDAGFDGIAGMDHMAPPLAEDQPMFEAMISTTWLAAHTSRLSLGTLVLCDSFRHPAQLAREAVSLDHASGGRFELGIGWGSVAREFDIFGVGSTEPRFRVSRLKESLDIITALWRGEAFDYEGEHFTLRSAQQRPTPARPHPHRHRWGGKEDDGTGRHLRGLVEPAHSDPGPLRGDAATGRPGPALPAGADGAHRIRGPPRGDRHDRPAPVRQEHRGRIAQRAGRLLRLARRRAGSNASTSGSPTSLPPRRWPNSAHR